MLSPVLLWLIIGSIFCIMELIFPTAFVELMMGLSAILVAGFALFIPYDNVLIILWMLFSIGLIFLTKKYVVTHKKEPLLLEESEGITISSIEPGKVGQVMYEGSSWSAICSDESLEIPPEETVYIVSRKGNILSVLPKKFI